MPRLLSLSEFNEKKMGIRNIFFKVIVGTKKARQELKQTSTEFTKTSTAANKTTTSTLKYEEATRKAAIQNRKLSTSIRGVRQNLTVANRRFRTFRSQMRQTTTAGTGLTGMLAKVGLAFGVLQAIRVAGQSLTDFNVQEEAEGRLLVALKGREDIQKRLIQQASDLQDITKFGDEATIEAQSILITQIGQNEEAVRRLIPLVQDLAVQEFKGNLVSAATLVGKSIGSAMNALSRYGIEITGAVGSSERLESALLALEKRYKGQAEALAQAGTGDLTQLANIVGDAREEFGKLIHTLIGEYTPSIKNAAKATQEFFKNVDVEKAKALIKGFITLVKIYLKFKLVQASINALMLIGSVVGSAYRLVMVSLALAKALYTKNTIRAAASTRLFFRILKSNPFVLFLATLVTILPLLKKYVFGVDEAAESHKKLTLAQQSSDRIEKQYTKNLKEQSEELKAKIVLLKQTKAGSDERKKAIDDINSTYGTTLKNLKDEKKFVEQVDKAYNDLIGSLQKKLRLQAFEEELTVLGKHLNKVDDGIDELEKDLLSKRGRMEDLLNDISSGISTAPERIGEELFSEFEQRKKGIDPFGEDQELLETMKARKLDLETQIKAIFEEKSKVKVDPDKLTPTGVGGESDGDGIVAGTISAMKKRISDLKKIRNEQIKLLIDGKLNVVKFRENAIKIDEETKRLNDAIEKISPVEPYKAADKSLDEIEKEIDSIGKAIEETQSRGFLTPKLEKSLQDAKARFKVAQEDLKKVRALNNLDLEEEELRHQQELINITSSFNGVELKTEEERQKAIIKLEIEFLKKRLAVRKELGLLTELEEKKTLNRIKELTLDSQKETQDKQKVSLKAFLKEFNLLSLDAKVDLLTKITNEVFSLGQTLISIQIRQLDALTSLQQQRVSDATALAKDGNVTLLEEEQKRLEALNRERAKFVRKEQALAAIQVATNAAVAITKAAAQGGAAAPFTIAATLIALAAGLAQARSLASQAAFKDGVIDYKGKGSGRSDSNVVSISNGESVITADGTSKAPNTLRMINEGLVGDSFFRNMSSGRKINLLSDRSKDGGRNPTPKELLEIRDLIKKQKSNQINFSKSGIVRTVEKAGHGKRRILTRI